MSKRGRSANGDGNYELPSGLTHTAYTESDGPERGRLVTHFGPPGDPESSPRPASSKGFGRAPDLQRSFIGKKQRTDK